MKKVLVAVVVIAMVVMGTVSLVGCEKSLDGTYASQNSPDTTLVIDGNKIKMCWTVEGKETVLAEGTFTREKNILTTTMTEEWLKQITVAKGDKLTHENGDTLETYVKLANKPK